MVMLPAYGKKVNKLPMLDGISQSFAPADEEPVGHGPPAPVFSVVIPAFNEVDCIVEFHRRLTAVMDPLGPWEAIYVDDGSQDGTPRALEALRRDDGRIGVISLSRNTGTLVYGYWERAISARKAPPPPVLTTRAARP